MSSILMVVDPLCSGLFSRGLPRPSFYSLRKRVVTRVNTIRLHDRSNLVT
jgi:hypothetical protein